MKKFSLLGIILLCCISGYYASGTIINILTSLVPKGTSLVALQPSDGFMVLTWGTVIASIIIFIFLGGLWLWLNFNDILYEKEKEFLTKIIPLSLFLFITGLISGVAMYLLMVLPYFIEINKAMGLTNVWSLNTVLCSALAIGLSFGLSFQMPLLIRFCINAGLVKKETFKGKTLHVLLIILVVSAILTPPDIISQLMLATPLTGMYMLAIR